ncbi:unnamed protein product [Protopolystoma xenopodis]|uniref:Uncharacterized protein n=1 Tax=Protopolystoma xenopodis TaxID=117903 RepID=A0A448XNN8_9PLAT|nr:unnamed protein product [Protopolystoma xenopodis]
MPFAVLLSQFKSASSQATSSLNSSTNTLSHFHSNQQSQSKRLAYTEMMVHLVHHALAAALQVCQQSTHTNYPLDSSCLSGFAADTQSLRRPCRARPRFHLPRRYRQLANLPDLLERPFSSGLKASNFAVSTEYSTSSTGSQDGSASTTGSLVRAALAAVEYASVLGRGLLSKPSSISLYMFGSDRESAAISDRKNKDAEIASDADCGTGLHCSEGNDTSISQSSLKPLAKGTKDSGKIQDMTKCTDSEDDDASETCDDYRTDDGDDDENLQDNDDHKEDRKPCKCSDGVVKKTFDVTKCSLSETALLARVVSLVYLRVANLLSELEAAISQAGWGSNLSESSLVSTATNTTSTSSTTPSEHQMVSSVVPKQKTCERQLASLAGLLQEAPSRALVTWMDLQTPMDVALSKGSVLNHLVAAQASSSFLLGISSQSSISIADKKSSASSTSGFGPDTLHGMCAGEKTSLISRYADLEALHIAGLPRSITLALHRPLLINILLLWTSCLKKAADKLDLASEARLKGCKSSQKQDPVLVELTYLVEWISWAILNHGAFIIFCFICSLIMNSHPAYILHSCLGEKLELLVEPLYKICANFL